MNALSFKPMPGHERGAILRLLQESYNGLAQIDRHSLSRWELDWRKFDDDIFNHPDTIGASGFVTYQGKTIIGFASWDPRKHPTATVGHNCILPAFRRRGYGKQQIEELLRRLKSLGFTKARTTTGDHPGFLAAQRMYLACGFRETRMFSDNTKTGWKMVELEKELSNQRLHPSRNRSGLRARRG
jgi:GNAT superfamily N-acetyltransferase